MLKFSKTGFNYMWTMNLRMFNLDLEKAEEPEIKLPISAGSLKKQESARRTSTSTVFQKNFYAKAFDGVDHNKLWKILQEMEQRTTLLSSWEIYMQVKKQQLEPDMEQHTGSKLGKEYLKAVCCHPAYLTYMQSKSWKMLSWMKHKLESRLPGKIWITSDKQMTSPFWQWKGTAEPFDEGERGEWKTGFKLKIQKTKFMISGPITSC